MKRVYKGYLPKKDAFFHNILFALVDSDGHGLEDYIPGGRRHNKDGQGFKVTILIERTTPNQNQGKKRYLLKQ